MDRCGSSSGRVPIPATDHRTGKCRTSAHGEDKMPQSERFDVLVLGSGTAGKLTAWHMAQSGLRTAAVERRWVGGACPRGRRPAGGRARGGGGGGGGGAPPQTPPPCPAKTRFAAPKWRIWRGT